MDNESVRTQVQVDSADNVTGSRSMVQDNFNNDGNNITLINDSVAALEPLDKTSNMKQVIHEPINTIAVPDDADFSIESVVCPNDNASNNFLENPHKEAQINTNDINSSTEAENSILCPEIEKETYPFINEDKGSTVEPDAVQSDAKSPIRITKTQECETVPPRGVEHFSQNTTLDIHMDNIQNEETVKVKTTIMKKESAQEVVKNSEVIVESEVIIKDAKMNVPQQQNSPGTTETDKEKLEQNIEIVPSNIESNGVHGFTIVPTDIKNENPIEATVNGSSKQVDSVTQEQVQDKQSCNIIPVAKRTPLDKQQSTMDEQSLPDDSTTIVNGQELVQDLSQVDIATANTLMQHVADGQESIETPTVEKLAENRHRMRKRRSSVILQEITYEQIVNDAKTMPHFLEFLMSQSREHSADLLFCWLEMEQYKEISGQSTLLLAQGWKIYHKYIDKNSSFVRHLDKLLPPKQYSEYIYETGLIFESLSNREPSLDMFSAMQRVLSLHLKTALYPAFLESNSFQALCEDLKSRKFIPIETVLNTAGLVRFLEAFILAEHPNELGNLLLWLDIENHFKKEANRVLQTSDDVSGDVLQGVTTENAASNTETPVAPKSLKSKSASFVNLLPVGAAPLSAQESISDIGEELLLLIGSTLELKERYFSAETKHLNASGVSQQACNIMEMKLCTKLDFFNIPMCTSKEFRSSLPDFVLNWKNHPKFSSFSTVGGVLLVVKEEIADLVDVFEKIQRDLVHYMKQEIYPKFQKSDFYASLCAKVKDESISNQDSLQAVFMRRDHSEKVLIIEIEKRVIGPAKECDSIDEMEMKHPLIDSVWHIGTNLAEDYSTLDKKSIKSHCFLGVLHAVLLLHQENTVEHLAFSECQTSSLTSDEDTEDDNWDSDDNKSTTRSLPEQFEVNGGQRHNMKQYNENQSNNFEFVLQRYVLPRGLKYHLVGNLDTTSDVTIPSAHLHCFSIPKNPSGRQKTASVVGNNLFGVCLTRYVPKDYNVSVFHRFVTDPTANDPKLFYTFSVSLEKNPTIGLGLNLASRNGQILLSHFSACKDGSPGPAEETGQLRIGDWLTAVNGVPVSGRDFGEVVSQIKNTPSEIIMQFTRRKDDETSGITFNDEQHKLELFVPDSVILMSKYPCFKHMINKLQMHINSDMLNVNEFKLNAAVVAKLLDAKASEQIFVEMENSGPLLVDKLLSIISPRNLIEVMTSFLLEKRIILCSNSSSLTTLFAETIRMLLKPFQWRHCYIPLLPLCDFAKVSKKWGQTTPFLVGVCTVDLELPSRKVNTCTYDYLNPWSMREHDLLLPCDLVKALPCIANQINNETIVVDLDYNLVVSQQQNEQCVSLPSSLKSQVLIDIQSVQHSKVFNRNKLRDHTSERLTWKKLHSCFLRSYQSLLFRFQEYFLTFDDGVLGGSEQSTKQDAKATLAFNAHAFIENAPQDRKKFLKRFIWTETFAMFLREHHSSPHIFDSE